MSPAVRTSTCRGQRILETRIGHVEIAASPVIAAVVPVRRGFTVQLSVSDQTAALIRLWSVRTPPSMWTPSLIGWLRFERSGSRDGWGDMAAFAERQRDAALRERLERAIEGTGAVRRFRDLVHQESLADHWYAFPRRGHPRGLTVSPRRAGYV